MDLQKKKYSTEELAKNIYSLHLWEILETQIIDEFFAAKYILNPCFQLTKEEENIKISDVLRLQKHLDINKLLHLYLTDSENYQIPFPFPFFDLSYS